MSRAPSVALFALLSALPAVARAERTETPPQQFKGGDTVRLYSLGVKITLPTHSDWTLAVAVDGTRSFDVLRPLTAATPGLQIELSKSAKPDCNEVAAALDASGLKRAPTDLSPATWDPWVYPVDGKLRMCSNTIDGPVLADLSAQATTIAAADLVPLLQEVSRVLGGRRSERPLLGKGPVVSQVGTITLPLAGVRVVVPTGWSVKRYEDRGRAVELLERFEPKEPALYLIVRRALGKCGLEQRPGDAVVQAPSYLPLGFSPRVLERPKGDGHESTLCVEVGPDAVVVDVTWTRREDLLDVKTMLARVAELEVGIGTSFSSSRANEVLEEVDRVRASLTADAHALTAWGRERALGGGLSLDAWAVSNTPDRAFGLGAELSGGVGYGARGLSTWNARFGLGPSLLLGPVVLLPLASIGADAIAGTDADMASAGLWSLGGRLSLRLANGFAVTFSGADARRFGGAPTITHERRFGVALTLRSVALGAQMTELDPEHSRARLATFSIGYAF